jgi:DNA processing protein
MGKQEIFRELVAGDETFRELFAKLADDPRPPKNVFARSLLTDETFREIFRAPSVAIVGSRKPTAYGEKITLELSQVLAEHGVVIISGLALGHDALAHRGSLDGGGTTIAVLGTPIDRLYPAQNLSLAKEILARGGIILSEIAAGEEFFAKSSFLQRNRIISALADVVIVVEANVKSGSLNTAKHAKVQQQNSRKLADETGGIFREKILMAVPGNLTSPLSGGTNALIRSGAKICLGAESVLTELREIYKNDAEIFAKLGGKPKKSHKQSTTNFAKTGDPESDKILARVAEKSLTTDEILREFPDAGGKLTLLELDSLIAKVGENWTLN